MRMPRLSMAVAGAVLLVDAVSKAVVVHWLVPGRVLHVGSLASLELYYNHAGARNLLTGRPLVVSGLSLLSCLGLAVLSTRTRSPGLSLGLGLLLGGGVANLVDRLFGAPGPLRGGVIDWLRPLHSSGSLNLADVAINLGLVVLAVTVIRRSWITRRMAPGSEMAAGASPS